MSIRILSGTLVLLVGCAQSGHDPEPLAHDDAPVLGTMERDVVALIDRNDDVAGSDAYEVIHGYFRYRFASSDHAQRFSHDPERYRIQLGGGCGRMGALSGTGSTDLYALHRERVYIFSSEGCRTGFLAEPAACLLPSVDEVPSAQRLTGKYAEEMFRSMKARFAPRGSALLWSLVPPAGEESTGWFRQDWYGGMGRYSGLSRYGDWERLFVVNPTRSVVSDEHGPRSLMPSQERALGRRIRADLNALFQAANVDDLVEDHVVVGADGDAQETVMTLVVDGFVHEVGYRGDGEVLSHRYLARGRDANVGWVRDEFVRWQTVGPFTVPVAWLRSFAGSDAVMVDRIADGWSVEPSTTGERPRRR